MRLTDKAEDSTWAGPHKKTKFNKVCL